jgi:hypothetical protein
MLKVYLKIVVTTRHRGAAKLKPFSVQICGAHFPPIASSKVIKEKVG